MLSAVVDKVGDSELGRRAAQKALDCLVRINTERFGRKAEIAAATRRLANWLRQHPAQDVGRQAILTVTDVPCRGIAPFTPLSGEVERGRTLLATLFSAAVDLDGLFG